MNKMLKQVLTNLEEIYKKRDRVNPTIDAVANFYKTSVFPDLIAIGEKIHNVRGSGDIVEATLKVILPRTSSNIAQLEREIESIHHYFDSQDESGYVKSAKRTGTINDEQEATTASDTNTESTEKAGAEPFSFTNEDPA